MCIINFEYLTGSFIIKKSLLTYSIVRYANELPDQLMHTVTCMAIASIRQGGQIPPLNIGPEVNKLKNKYFSTMQ